MTYKVVGDDYQSGFRNCMSIVQGMSTVLGNFWYFILFLSPNFYYYALIYTPIFICASIYLLFVIDEFENEVVIEIFV